MVCCVTSAAGSAEAARSTRQNHMLRCTSVFSGLTLLYVGISPKPPSSVGTPSRQTLRRRLRYHFRGNAEGSTLRLSLGCLLSQSLGIELRRVGSGRRMTFGAGERALNDWLERSARVAWLACDEPWRVEEHMIVLSRCR